MRAIGKMREFKTAHFRVIAEALPEDDLDLSFDEDGSVLEGLRSGEFVAFVAHVAVYHDTLGKVADEYLGGCIYRSPDEFMDHQECGKQNREYAERGETGRCGSYFHDMVRQACGDARKAIRAAQTIKVRGEK